MTLALQVRISGRVQGVGYRAWLAAQADQARLEGWVRNRRDGTVEALLAGPEIVVRGLVDRCWQGPALARVSAVETTPAPAPTTPGFAVRPTA